MHVVIQGVFEPADRIDVRRILVHAAFGLDMTIIAPRSRAPDAPEPASDA